MSTKKLQTLAEYDALVKSVWEKSRQPKGTGVACPACGAELFDQKQKIQGARKYTVCSNGECKGVQYLPIVPGEL